ncbi:MAG: 1-deoxy-D-xylulose-5-phosphate reductoisomerase [Gammaproteobacteria bacterium]|nr:MAG: 1-deoxy-D-xylulose-5-phosphate reductoisomerase [Gammaproteobacteria bacterium]RKZ74362.1 MAG: 1-deoxy-D-xylulose-5-phosphate reductoisomerase [Gammaproteobacteria bacterium]
MKSITILGATGSIGLNTLDVIKQHQSAYEVIALTAHRQIDRLEALCLEWSPRYAVMADARAAEQLSQRLKKTDSPVQVLSGVEGLTFVASLAEVDFVMAAIVGSAGLLPTLAAAQAGKRVLLANKEALVMSGQLFMEAVRQHGAELLPIDSEHNAVFQCLPWENREWGVGNEALEVNRILLTASGGPFRTLPIEQLHDVTPEQACAHPNWNMGRKISVDSATMMNKGLEVIEAAWLFSVPSEKIEVILHPQSVIHSLVEYIDGSMLAQLGNPDMRTPIAYGLAWPKRISSGVPRLNLIEVAQLDFEALDLNRFPCLKLAYDAWLAGGTATTILNAANEVAVQAFLQKRLRFTAIPKVVETTLSQLSGHHPTSIDIILEDDAHARHLASEWVNRTDN